MKMNAAKDSGTLHPYPTPMLFVLGKISTSQNRPICAQCTTGKANKLK